MGPFSWGGGGVREGVGSVRMVMEECPPDGLGRNGHTEFNQYYVQFQETIKIYADYIQHVHALGALDKIIVKIHNITEN